MVLKSRRLKGLWVALVIVGGLSLGFAVLVLVHWYSGGRSWAFLPEYTVLSYAIMLIFLLFGIISLGFGIYQYSTQKVHKFRLLPLLVGGTLIVFTFLLWHALSVSQVVNTRSLTSLQSAYVQQEILGHFQSGIYGVSSMADRWTFRGGIAKAEWQADANNFVMHYPIFSSFQRIDAKNEVQWVVPYHHAQAPAHLHAFWKRQSLSMNHLGAVGLTGVLDLEKGRPNFYIYSSLYVDKKFDGYVMGVLDVRSFLTFVLSNEIERGYGFAIYQGSQKIYQGGEYNKALQEKWGVEKRLRLQGLDWVIVVWPSQRLLDQGEAMLPSIVLIVGLIIAFLLMFMMFISQHARKQGKLVELAEKNFEVEAKEHRRTEKLKDALEEALHQSQKLQAIGTLAGGIAHDFNNILYAIMGYAEMARQDVEKGSVVHKNLGKMLAASERGKKLVSSILSFSRRTQVEFKSIDLLHVLDTAFDLLLPVVPANIKLVKKVNVEKAIIYGDHTDLEQVIINVVNNAIDAIKKHGCIEVCLKEIKATQTPISNFSNLSAKCYFHLSIQDNGSGMKEKELDRLFDPFYTTKEVGSGTGLGLSIAHGIIESHHGMIVVNSQLGQGTVFHIYLPQYESVCAAQIGTIKKVKGE